jgi:hypothetical protein
VASYGLSHSRQAHWYDSLASSAIASGYSYFITPRYSKYVFYSSLEPMNDGGMVRAGWTF